MIFVAQLWKYNGERLENKNGDWMYLEETWILPKENEKNEHEAIRNSLGKILKVENNDRGMHLTHHKFVYVNASIFHQK